MSVEENKALTKDYIENHLLAYVRGDEHDMGAFLAPDVAYHTASIAPHDDHATTIFAEGDALRDAFRDVDLRVDRMAAEGDLVAWSATFHHHGDYPHVAGHIEATGQQLEVGGMSLYRFENGRIADIWVYTDMWDAVRTQSVA